MNKIFLRLFLVLIPIISFIYKLRLITFADYGFEQDEIEWTTVSQLLEKKFDPNMFGVWSAVTGLANHFPVSIIMSQISIKLFGLSYYSPRIFIALIMSIYSLLIYWINAQYVSKINAFYVTIFFITSSYFNIMNQVILQHIYSLISLIPALALLLLGLKTKKLPIKMLTSFITGFFLLTACMTYNINYLMPIVIFLSTISGSYIFYIHSTHHINSSMRLSLLGSLSHYRYSNIHINVVLKSLLVGFIALLPTLFASQYIFKSIVFEQHRGAYALANNAASLHRIDFNQIKKNGNVVYKQLFRNLGYENTDMIVMHSGTLFPLLISGLAVIGSLYAIVRWKKYYLHLIWIVFGFIISQVIIGLYLPRMWVNSAVLIIMLSALGIEAISKISKHLESKLVKTTKLNFLRINYIFYILLTIGTIQTVFNEKNIIMFAQKNRLTYSKEFSRIINHFSKDERSIITVAETDFDDALSICSFYLSKSINNQTLLKDKCQDLIFIRNE